ncbi:uncharacterized protein [Drosophila bipectinata]|uniref:uncharacterized protein n=1 Tax=Drosophila bipectinata TaxID=42026 RepID=UPI0038B28C52
MDKQLAENVSSTKNGQRLAPKIKALLPDEIKDELKDLKAKVTQGKVDASEKGEESDDSEEDDWKDAGTDSSDQEYYSDWESSYSESGWEESDSEGDYSDKEALIGPKHVVHKTKKYKHVGQERSDTKKDKWKLVVNCYRSRGKMWKLHRRARLKGQVKGGQNPLKVAMEVWYIKEIELNTSKEDMKNGYETL